ncbi:MAG: hypothetical protein Q8O26_18970 [Phreatobacter sp.]|uniref:hypothetical protein n=1 Tax=Phreatobacter sp. TaxID=1966341 RepID=UPI0027370E47|nr:hypothetical protein [Phreatobacter sp.]MDP2803960.1 hypothetical protein [Phreatobacter sp.]
MAISIRPAIAILASTMVLGACARVTAVPAPPGSDVHGIRVYEQKPLLVVSGQQVSVTFVPNTNRAYALQFSSFLAKHDLTAAFTPSGAMSSLTSNQDTTAVAVALVNLVQKAVEVGRPIGGAFSGTSAPTLNERLQVYEFVFDDGGNLIQLRPLINQNDLIRLPRQRTAQAFTGTPPGTNQQPPSPTTDAHSATRPRDPN